MEQVAATQAAEPKDALERSRGAIGATLGIAVVGYVAYAVIRGAEDTTGALTGFRWSLYVPVLLLTLVNYGMRFFKWAWLLHRLGVDVPLRANAWVFTAGLGMVISPGKAGELVKPYLVKSITGVPMMRTIPALVTERLTDGIAVVILAAFGVSTFYAEKSSLIYITLAAVAVGIAVVSVEALTTGVLDLLEHVPVIRRVVPALRDASASLRTCLSPAALVVTIGASLLAWWAECVGYWLVFRGLAVDASLDVSTFLYSFATVFGAPSPGGMGMADVALVEGGLVLIPTMTESEALAAALLVRVATLWFGVLLGAVALMRMDRIVSDARATLSEQSPSA